MYRGVDGSIQKMGLTIKTFYDNFKLTYYTIGITMW